MKYYHSGSMFSLACALFLVATGGEAFCNLATWFDSPIPDVGASADRDKQRQYTDP